MANHELLCVDLTLAPLFDQAVPPRPARPLVLTMPNIPRPDPSRPRTWQEWAPFLMSISEEELRELAQSELEQLVPTPGMTSEQRGLLDKVNVKVTQEKARRRRVRNNQSAAKTRKRKQDELEAAHKRIDELERELARDPSFSDANARVMRLVSENKLKDEELKNRAEVQHYMDEEIKRLRIQHRNLLMELQAIIEDNKVKDEQIRSLQRLAALDPNA